MKKKIEKKINLKDRIDPKETGVPNICFSLVSEGDGREAQFKKERIKYGFDESETWCLTSTFAKFMLPRLERFYEITKKVNVENKEWNEKIEQTLEALKLLIRDNGSWIFTKDERKALEKGIKALSYIFADLWW